MRFALMMSLDSPTTNHCTRAILSIRAQSSRLAEFGGRGMSFNICRGTDGDHFAVTHRTRFTIPRVAKEKPPSGGAQRLGVHSGRAPGKGDARIWHRNTTQE